MDNDYMKPQEALGLLCSAIRCGEKFGPAHEKARLSILSALAQAADAGRYKEAYFAEREDNLWNAYNSGHVKDGRWSHLFMSDGEWLARECGFDPCDPDYDDAEIRAAIPTIARQAPQGEA